MTWLLSSVALFAILVAAFLAFELRHARQGYEAIYILLIRDRDAAREEVATLRKALFPQLERITQPAKPQTPSQIRTPIPPNTQPQIFKRIPWRQQFREMVRTHNTRQIDHDRTAQTIRESQTSQPAAKETP